MHLAAPFLWRSEERNQVIALERRGKARQIKPCALDLGQLSHLKVSQRANDHQVCIRPVTITLVPQRG